MSIDQRRDFHLALLLKSDKPCRYGNLLLTWEGGIATVEEVMFSPAEHSVLDEIKEEISLWVPFRIRTSSGRELVEPRKEVLAGIDVVLDRGDVFIVKTHNGKIEFSRYNETGTYSVSGYSRQTVIKKVGDIGGKLSYFYSDVLALMLKEEYRETAARTEYLLRTMDQLEKFYYRDLTRLILTYL